MKKILFLILICFSLNAALAENNLCSSGDAGSCDSDISCEINCDNCSNCSFSEKTIQQDIGVPNSNLLASLPFKHIKNRSLANNYFSPPVKPPSLA